MKKKYNNNLESFEEQFPLLPSEYQDENNMILEMLKFGRPLTDEDFGFYLAGLIEGDGGFSSDKLEISFHSFDISLAHYIKTRLQVGNIYKVKGKRNLKYTVSNKEGLKKILNLINGKFYSNYKIDYMIKHNYQKRLGIQILSPINHLKHPINSNFFLAGFADSDGNFSINLLKSNTHSTGVNVTLTFRIKQKNIEIINIIKNTFGGSISYFKTKDISCYSSTSFKVLPLFVQYFDKYNLQSTKFINYIKWKKAAKIVQMREHLTKDGIEKLIRIKNTMNNKLFDLPEPYK